MKTWLGVLAFELRYQLQQPLFAILVAVFFLLGFIAMASDTIQVGDGTANLLLNAPFALIQTQAIFVIIGTFAAIAFAATPITRDAEFRMSELILATPAAPRILLSARFVAAYCAALMVVFAALLGTVIGTLMPWLDQDRIAPFSAAPHWFNAWAISVPSLFIECAILFSLAALMRSIMGAYVGALGLMTLYAVVGALTTPETIKTTSLLDPYGMIPLMDSMRYWTVFDKNNLVPGFSGGFALNRLLWLAGSAALLAAVIGFYRPRLPVLGKQKPERKIADESNTAEAAVTTTKLSTAQLRWRQWLSQLRIDLAAIVRAPGFAAMVAFGVFNALFSIMGTVDDFFGTAVYPATGMVVGVLFGTYFLALLMVLVYYTGELTHRERSINVADLIDVTTTPSVIFVLSKIVAVWCALTVALVAALTTGIAVQLAYGFFDIKPEVYLVGVFVALGGTFYLLTPIAVMLNAIAPNKFIGMGLLVLLFLILISLGNAGFEHSLYQVGFVPPLQHSDINGWDPNIDLTIWLLLYWGALGVIAAIVTHLFWRRGAAEPFSLRWRTARQRLRGASARVLASATFAFVTLGAFIFYNTNVLNTYQSQDSRDVLAADYEKHYKKFENLPILDTSRLDMAVDIFPQERRIDIAAHVELVNLTRHTVDQLHLTIPAHLSLQTPELGRAQLVAKDERLGYQQLRLDPPLAPNERMTMRWQSTWENKGFVDNNPNTRVLENGTFFDTTDVLPTVGYQRAREITDPAKRRKFDLPPPRRAPPRDQNKRDLSAFQGTARTEFRAVLSTDPDQIAMSPGYLKRQWTEAGRLHFEYQTDEPIWAFASFSSARFATKKDRWNDQVDIEVLYHPEHAYNLDTMIASTKASLDYFSKAFSPYQYRQFRILEFPGYRTFAQSFPNTIPFSESIGFMADLRDEQSIDYVYYVTAHEMAHQWWGHQVLPADMQGATMIIESLAQYSSLMVMEQRFGRETMRRFLRYELDRYLRNRGAELIEEQPLGLVEDQAYIHYGKGSLAFYALQDYLGEERVNAALKRFIDRFAFKAAPFPSTLDLIAEFRVHASAEENALIDDLFEKIVIFDLKLESATLQPLPNGRYQVDVVATAAKFESDGKGESKEVPFSMDMDLGVFAERDSSIGDENLPPSVYLQRHRVQDGENRFSVVVDQLPGSVGIDPLNVLIDRAPDDNVKVL